jgi:hypothetical protein
VSIVRRVQQTLVALSSIAVAAIVVGDVSAAAQRETVYIPGSNLRSLCTSPEKSGEKAMCIAFVSAVLEIAANDSVYGVHVCLPPNLEVSVARAVDITTRWLNAHPDVSPGPATHQVVSALAEAFPCKK